MDSASCEFANFILHNTAWITSMIEAIPDGILITDADGVVLFVNTGYLAVTGLERQDIIGKKLAQVRPGSLLPQALKDRHSRTGTFRREGDTEYIVDVGPIFCHEAIVGGMGVIKALENVQKLSHELEKHVKKTNELKTAVNRAYRARYTFQDVIGESVELQRAVIFAKKIARYDTDILITGESGTGKEVFAQAIHNASSRAESPFIPVNCPTLHGSLFESELFGYNSGTFTGALKGGKVGLFAVADGGTVMLDEIGDLPYEMQAKLLRVLQERTIRRLGDSSEEPVAIRVIAATNRDLKALVREGRFREDLFYRLSAVQLALPNLRERKQDLQLLADYFLAEWCKRQGNYLTFDPRVYIQMERYDWPGNIREFRHVIDLSAYTCDGRVITELPLPTSVISGKPELGHCMGGQRSLKAMLNEAERTILKNMLDRYGDTVESKKQIAAQLKISLATLYNKINTLLNES